MVAPDDTFELNADLLNKSAVVDADELLIADSESLSPTFQLKKLTLLNLKNFIGTGDVVDVVPLFSAIDRDNFLLSPSSRGYPLSGSVISGGDAGDASVAEFAAVKGTYRNFSVKVFQNLLGTGSATVQFRVNSSTVQTITIPPGTGPVVLTADVPGPIIVNKNNSVNYAIIMPNGETDALKLEGISCTVDVAGVSGITSLNGDGVAAQTLTGGDGVDVTNVTPDHSFAVDSTVVRTTGAQSVSNKELINIRKIDYTRGLNTLVSGNLGTLFNVYIEVLSEGGGAPDDLDTIPAGTDGQVIIIRPNGTSGTITVTSAGNIQLIANTPFVMSDIEDFMALLFDGTDWVEQYRTGGLVLLDTAQTLTNKTITAAANFLTIASTDLTDTSILVRDSTANTYGGFLQNFLFATMRIPTLASPVITTNGDFSIESGLADFNYGIIKYFSTEEVGIVSMPSDQFDSPTDGNIIAYNGTLGDFELITPPVGAGARFTWAASDEDAAFSSGLLYTTEAADSAKAISKIVLSLKNAPTGSLIEVDILLETTPNNFVSIFTTNPSIPIGDFSSSTTTGISTSTWTSGKRLQIVLTSNDSAGAASGLKVTIA